MAAGTESAVDTRTYNSPSLVGNIVEKVLLARQLAENERKFAEKKAAEAGTSLEEVGIEKGFFFKQALRGEFGGNFVDKKTKQLKGIVKKYKIAKRISKNPKVAFNFIKPILAAKAKRKPAGAQTKMFRAKFDYTNYDDVPTTPKTPVVGATAKKIQKATTSRSKRISREELLSSITEIANSLNKTAESIGRTTSGVSASMISSTNASMQLVEQLKTRNTTLEDKLNEIAKAISEQTQFQRQSVSRTKAARAEDKLENQTDIAAIETPDDTSTAENETLIAQLTTPTSPITNVQNISSSIGGTSTQNIEHQQMNAYNNIPQAESGGIISGPDSGYLAKLHGDELVVPLKNNYTEGRKSAVDGKVRRRPSSNSSGGVTSSSLGGRFGFGITNMTGIASGGSTQASALTQPLVDAMSLIPMAVGGGTLAQLTSLMTSMGSEAPIIGPYIQQASRSLANVFGLPSAIVNKATGKSKVKEGEQPKDKEEGESKKNIIDKMKEGFAKLLEKLREGINNPPSPPPGAADLSPVSLENFSQDDTTLLGKMLFAEAGTSPEGTAHVLNSILNRYRQIKSGRATPQSWGIQGKTKDEVTIRDILYADGQYTQSLPKLETITADQATQSLNAAISAGGLDPQQIYRKAKEGGKSEREAKMLATSDTYYNPKLSSNKPFSDAPVVNTDNKHAFMASPNVGYKPEDLSTLEPVTQTTQPRLPSQEIERNYGMNPTDKFEFVLGGQRYEAYKTTKGFDFFEVTPNPLDANPKVTDPEKLKVLSESLQELKTKTISPPEQEVGFNPPAGKPSVARAEAISTPLDSNGPGNVVAMMLPQGEQAQTATTVTPSTHETASADRSRNDVKMSQIYPSSLTLG